MKYLSVCAGIEAASVAWHDLGWEPVLFSEIEAFPRKVLAHRQNAIDARQTGAAARGVPLWGDFTAIRPRFLKRLGIDGTVELVVGGTPCQDFSVAGKRAGLDGARGNLTREFAHLLRRTKPRWFVWENVPGAFSLNSGKDFAAVLARFAGHAPGSAFAVPREGWRNSGVVPPAGPGCYGLAWRVLDAQYVRVDSAPNAVPQRRRRVFVIGYLGDWRPAAAVLLERESMHGDTPPRREPGQIPAPTLSARPRAGGGLGTDFDLDGGLVTQPAVAGAICRDSLAGDAGGRPDGAAAGHFVVSGYSASGDGYWHEGIGPLRARPQESHEQLVVPNGFGGGNTSDPIDAAACLTAKGQRIDFETETFVINPPEGNDNTSLAFDCKTSGRNGFAIGEVAPTLRAMGSLHSHQNAGGQVAVVNRGDVRRLTPLECDRLQNFPDNYTLIPMQRRRPISFDEAKYYWRQAEPGIKCWCENGKWYTNAASDGPRYKGLGNSMATNVMRWIGTRIEMVEQIINERIAA